MKENLNGLMWCLELKASLNIKYSTQRNIKAKND